MWVYLWNVCCIVNLVYNNFVVMWCVSWLINFGLCRICRCVVKIVLYCFFNCWEILFWFFFSFLVILLIVLMSCCNLELVFLGEICCCEMWKFFVLSMKVLLIVILGEIVIFCSDCMVYELCYLSGDLIKDLWYYIWLVLFVNWK